MSVGCNLRKGPNIAGLNPISGAVTRLFRPRQDAWDEHFAWDTAWLRGKTAIGRTTIAVLEINGVDVIALRESLLAEGEWDWSRPPLLTGANRDLIRYGKVELVRHRRRAGRMRQHRAVNEGE